MGTQGKTQYSDQLELGSTISGRKSKVEISYALLANRSVP